MLSELHGIGVIDGELAIVGVKQTGAGPEFITMPVQAAHVVGCMLIELSEIAVERESDLRSSGTMLDVRAMADEFMARVRRRQELNSSAVRVNRVSGD